MHELPAQIEPPVPQPKQVCRWHNHASSGLLRLRCTFKGVTYETLKDPSFIDHCKKVYPDLEQATFEEYDAAKATEADRELRQDVAG